jgi:hypothetical protein
MKSYAAQETEKRNNIYCDAFFTAARVIRSFLAKAGVRSFGIVFSDLRFTV